MTPDRLSPEPGVYEFTPKIMRRLADQNLGIRITFQPGEQLKVTVYTTVDRKPGDIPDVLGVLESARVNP